MTVTIAPLYLANCVAWTLVAATQLTHAAESGPLALGNQRQLFVDEQLIESKTGVVLAIHNPQAKDVALVCDAPWEGNISAYYTLFQDGDIIRAYYRGAHYDEKTKKESHAEFTCYAESHDGLRFTKPKLGLFDFAGSKDNNIIHSGDGTHNFSPFKDSKPDCTPATRYKALAGGFTLLKGKKKSCLYAYQSADGIHWSKLSEEAVITDGAFDSQNIAFYDAEQGVYRAYWRYFSSGYTDERGWKPEGQRAIRTAVSKDFLHWEKQADLQYGDAPREHLYTNAVMPYFRAPQLLIGFPTRFQPKNQQVEPVFMSSHNGVLFHRWPEPLIPITAPQDRDGNRSNYMARGLLQLPGQDRELSVYGTEAYYKGPGSRLRRFTFRSDGFVSAQASGQGTLVTKPFTFSGTKLALNIASTGPSRVELQDSAGKPLPGFTLADCQPIQTDAIQHPVTWKGGDLTALAGKPVRLLIQLDHADLYALHFLP